MPGTITVVKTDDAAPEPNPLAGTAFTLFVDNDGDGTHDGVPADTVAQGPTATSAGGTLSSTAVPVGKYWVVETTTPTGCSTAAPQCVTVSLGGSAGAGQTMT